MSRKKSVEKRLEEGRGSDLARKCWEEIRERAQRGGGISRRGRKGLSLLLSTGRRRERSFLRVGVGKMEVGSRKDRSRKDGEGERGGGL